MKISIITGLIFIVCVTACVFSSAQAEESITITTYYPSPYGVYSSLRLFPNTKDQSFPCDSGELYFSNVTGSEGIYFCNQNRNWQRFDSLVAVGGVPSSSVCSVGQLKYESPGTGAIPKGLYVCSASGGWEPVSSAQQPQFEFGGMYENGEGSCDPITSVASLYPAQYPCCETPNKLLSPVRCGCPTGFSPTCLEGTDEPAAAYQRRDEYCYCYKQNS
jgi:hypothetical protein